jgi:hypothetical protein
MAPMTPIASIRLCGPHTHHNNETLFVVIASAEVARSSPNLVTLEQARDLVGRGDAVWINPPPEVSSAAATSYPASRSAEAVPGAFATGAVT